MFEIGTSLREARLRQGLDFPELEQATKIRGKYLRALEEEKFDALPAATYVKGFLRTYADSLGLDGQLYVDEYNSRFVVGEDEVPVRPRRSGPAQPLARRIETRAILVALGAIAAITALVFAAWRFGTSDNPRYPAAKPPAGPPAQVRARTPQRPVRAAPRPVRISLVAASGSCWLQVFAGSPSGKLLFEGTLDAGKSQLWTQPRLWISAGAPRNLVVRVNGRLRTIPGNGAPTQFIATRLGLTPAQTHA